MRRRSTIAWMLFCLPGVAIAQDFHWQGYIDGRLQSSSGDDNSWTDGGLGKTRFGADAGNAVQFGGAALAGTWQVTPSLLAVTDVQANAATSPKIGLLDAYVRYRPVSTTPWRWSVKLGAFFPPISLEMTASRGPAAGR